MPLEHTLTHPFEKFYEVRPGSVTCLTRSCYESIARHAAQKTIEMMRSVLILP